MPITVPYRSRSTGAGIGVPLSGCAVKQVTVAILPRPGLSPDDCQRLASSLAVALSELPATEERPGGSSGIEDLVAGELPKALVLRVMAFCRKMKRSFGGRQVAISSSELAAECKKKLAGDPMIELCDVPTVFIVVPTEGADSRDAVADRVRALLPQELIHEVRVIYPSMNR